MIELILCSMLISFFLTIMIEFIIMELIIREKKNYLKAFILINLITNPTIVLIYSILYLINFKYILVITIILEVIVVVIEGKLYKVFLNENKNIWYVNSLILNSFSYLLGCIISK